MVAEDGVGEHIDAEDRGEGFEPTANPFAAEGVIGAGLLIDPARKALRTHRWTAWTMQMSLATNCSFRVGLAIGWFPPLGWSIANRVAGSSIRWVAPNEVGHRTAAGSAGACILHPGFVATSATISFRSSRGRVGRRERRADCRSVLLPFP